MEEEGKVKESECGREDCSVPADIVDVWWAFRTFATLIETSETCLHDIWCGGRSAPCVHEGPQASSKQSTLRTAFQKFSALLFYYNTHTQHTHMLRARLRTKMLLNMFRRDRCATTMICLQGMELRTACDRSTLRMSHCVVKPFH